MLIAFRRYHVTTDSYKSEWRRADSSTDSVAVDQAIQPTPFTPICKLGMAMSRTTQTGIDVCVGRSGNTHVVDFVPRFHTSYRMPGRTTRATAARHGITITGIAWGRSDDRGAVDGFGEATIGDDDTTVSGTGVRNGLHGSVRPSQNRRWCASM
jgi:hypothetical protein